MEVAVIGNDDFVTGFALAGVRYTFTAETNLDERVEEAVRHEDIGVLVMEEEQFKSLNAKTKKMLTKLIRPVVVLMSDKGGQTDIREMIKRSLGVDLWR